MTKKIEIEEEKMPVGLVLALCGLLPLAFIGFVTVGSTAINFVETVNDTKVEVRDLQHRVDDLQNEDHGMTVYWTPSEVNGKQHKS